MACSYPLDFSDRSSSLTMTTGGSGKRKSKTSKMTWRGFEDHVLTAFEEFWRLGDFVDVTLICDDLTIRAHRIVLAACSEYFERIFIESDCKHPVILLKGFEGWEVEACVEFMYRGFIQVPRERVQEIVTAAGVLEIRGLADYVSKLEELTTPMRMPNCVGSRSSNNGSSKSCSNNNNYSSGSVTTPPTTRDSSVIMTEEPLEPPGMTFEFDNNPRSPKCLNLSMGAHLNESPVVTGVTGAVVLHRHSPLRRKQARPRRRSGDYVAERAQDLRKEKVNSDENQVIDYRTTTNSHAEVKSYHDHLHHHLPHDLPHIILEPSPPHNHNSDDGISSSNCVASPPTSPPYFFPKASPPSPEEVMEGHACTTPPIFSPFTNGFGHPPGPWPGFLDKLPLGPAPIFGRHRAQHSAPRGGPPRAWSNADLTEALHNVWNKKMTTSQASRIFGIPYNSLLMYVRGKYGKSLKLDLLKKGLDLAMENKKNNNSKSPESSTPPVPVGMLSTGNEFNPFNAGIFV